MSRFDTQEFLQCIQCPAQFPLTEVRYRCQCGGLLAVERTEAQWLGMPGRELFDERRRSNRPEDRSGVWRFREAILGVPVEKLVVHPEGETALYARESLSKKVGVAQFYLKHEGENPTGSFKDRGMTVAVTQAAMLGKRIVACASTGNTSAALAAYAAQAGMQALVLLPAGKVATGKVAQAIGYGAKCIGIAGDFDAAMHLVEQAADQLGWYLVNSVNPFRLEGQKTVMWEMLQDLGWHAPDWVVVPGGNLGNTSAFGKALLEAKRAGWIQKLPRIAVVQAAGANPFYQSYLRKFAAFAPVPAKTVATAIQIGNPVNYAKARVVMQMLNGVVCQVDDAQIMAAKHAIDRAGIGCEPASACSLAGAEVLVKEGVIKPNETVVGILTGHMLKDTDAVLAAAGMGDTAAFPTIQPTIAALRDVSAATETKN